MGNKTKWMALLICSTLLLGGCSSVDDTAASSTSQTIDAATPEVLETAAPTEASTQKGTPILSFTTEEKEWYMEDGSTLLMVVTDFTIDVENEGFEQLEAALDQFHPGIQEEDYTLSIEEAEENYSFLSEEDREYFWGYSSTKKATLTRSDSSVVSLRLFYHDFTGGAHGMYAYRGESFDVESGRLLELADILADTEGFYDKAIDYIADELYANYADELFPEYKEAVTEAFAPNQTSNWYLTGGGIVITFTPYEVGPYSMGAPEVTLPYSEFGSYMHEKYLASPDEVITHLTANHDYSYLLDTTEPIMVEAISNEWYMLDIRMVAGAISSELGTFSSFRNGYVIKRTDGRSFIIIVCDYMSDDYVTFVYEVTDGALKKCAELPAVYPSNEYVSAEKIEMNIQLDILGSYIATSDYVFTEDGQFMQEDNFYPINATHPLNIVKELPVTLDGVEATLSPGTNILVTGTNNVDEVHFKVVDSNQTGIIHYSINDQDSWTHMIDGISEYEYFENLPYAG